MNASSQLGSVPVTTAVSEYKPFGGVLAPTITRQRMMGLESVTTITAVSYDADRPEDIRAAAGNRGPGRAEEVTDEANGDDVAVANDE